MKTLLKVLSLVVLTSFAAVHVNAACGDGSCDGKKDDAKTEQKGDKK